MYLIVPHGVSRRTFHCSFGVQSSGVRFCSLTASHPARTAPSTICLASATEPLWLIPISAMTNSGSPSPTHLFPIRTAFLIVAARFPSAGPTCVALPNGEATIDDDVGSGEVARSIACQKYDRSAVVVCIRHAPERRSLGVPCDEVLVLAVSHSSRRESVHPNAPCAPVGGEVTGQ